ncbi:hypothetical protein C8R46DRAFT_1217556 [Mycena filopes]|nr:hypothetical protein C8R46DRAFT_1217556 [Mycena filopes]
MSGRPNLVPRPLSSANRTPSIEINTAVPMLTTLSLPASPDTSMSLDLDPIVSTSPRLSPIDGDDSPWTLSLSPASPVLSTVPDLSLSSPAAGNTVDGHVVSFPSPTSSSSPFVSPLPSPLLDSITESEYVGDTSAAEYAAAIMSSAWGSEGPSMTQVIPPALLSAENETPSPVSSHIDVEQAALASEEEEERPAALSYQENVPLRREEAKIGGMIGKMKKFSDRFKKLLRGKAKIPNGGVNIDVDVRRAGSSALPNTLPDVIDIQRHTSAARAYDNLLSGNDTDHRLALPLPPPPGLVLRKSKTRPILSSQTYSSSLTRSRTNDNHYQAKYAHHSYPSSQFFGQYYDFK